MNMRQKRTHARVLERYNSKKLGWLQDSLHFIILAGAIFLLLRFGIGVSLVGGDSMLPSLKSGELVLYSRIHRTYRPGDVISLRVPSGEYYIKRVAATGGDTVDLYDGRVYVNGARMPDPWSDAETLEETGAVIYPYTVREGNVFVLGDNRTVSMDSRFFGEVSLRQIRGKVLLAISLQGIRFF